FCIKEILVIQQHRAGNLFDVSAAGMFQESIDIGLAGGDGAYHILTTVALAGGAEPCDIGVEQIITAVRLGSGNFLGNGAAQRLDLEPTPQANLGNFRFLKSIPCLDVFRIGADAVAEVQSAARISLLACSFHPAAFSLGIGRSDYDGD